MSLQISGGVCVTVPARLLRLDVCDREYAFHLARPKSQICHTNALVVSLRFLIKWYNTFREAGNHSNVNNIVIGVVVVVNLCNDSVLK